MYRGIVEIYSIGKCIEIRDSIVGVDLSPPPCHPSSFVLVKDYSLIGSLWIPPL